jgi:hypothetical protein
MNKPTTLDAYREELTRLARLLTRDRVDEGEDLPVSTAVREQMRMFAEENIDKRIDKLGSQLEFVAEAFPDFGQFLDRYIEEHPQCAYDTVITDAQRFLTWLTETQNPTAEQCDHIVCQQARHELDLLARKKRIAHVRFQDLSGMASRVVEDLPTDETLRIYLNPIRKWEVFETHALLDEEAEVPASVLFYAVGAQITTAVLDPAGKELIEELAAVEPCTLARWAEHHGAVSRDELAEFCAGLADMGLIAFG